MPYGEHATSWAPVPSLRSSTDSKYEQDLRDRSYLAGPGVTDLVTHLAASGAEHAPDYRTPYPYQRISSAFLRSTEVDHSVGLFQMEIEAHSDMADIPDQDALALMDSADLASFLGSMDILTFTMAGIASGRVIA